MLHLLSKNKRVLTLRPKASTSKETSKSNKKSEGFWADALVATGIAVYKSDEKPEEVKEEEKEKESDKGRGKRGEKRI